MHKPFVEIRGKLNIIIMPGIGSQIQIEDEQGIAVNLQTILEEYDQRVCNHIIRIAIVEEGAEYHANKTY